MIEPIWQNFYDQPKALQHVWEYQECKGRIALLLAASKLQQSQRIILSGMGSSHFACLPLHYALAEKGIPSLYISSAELLHYQFPVCQNAVIVLASRSGETVEVVKLLPQLKKQKAYIIGVTNEPQSTLAREADLCLLTGSPTDQMVAIQTYTATLLTLGLIGMMTGEEKPEEMFSRAESIFSFDWEHFLEQSLCAVDQTKPLFEKSPQIYLLARGGSLASAMEGSLLFHEAAKYPAVWMEAGQFRHGPVEAIHKNCISLIFAPMDAIGDLNHSLALDIQKAGGHSILIGPLHDAHGKWLPHVDWTVPICPKALQPLLEIVPVQAAAIRFAEWRGLELGKFFFAPQVTRDETGFELLEKK